MYIVIEPYKIDVDIKEDIKIIEQLFEAKRRDNAANNNIEIELDIIIKAINNIDIIII